MVFFDEPRKEIREEKNVSNDKENLEDRK